MIRWIRRGDTMKKQYLNEFYSIVNPILNHSKFQELKGITHHGITRFDHCFRVAYYTYCITRFFHLQYKDATEAALLHDFFLEEVKEENGWMRLQKHPKFAAFNAKKYFSISDFQEDIILCHMFPVTLRPPKYLEGWIVDFIDDISAIYERGLSIQEELKAACLFIFILVVYSFPIR